jgi:hypothetical protein
VRRGEDRLADGVPESDLALYHIEDGHPVVEMLRKLPALKFSKGSFKPVEK